MALALLIPMLAGSVAAQMTLPIINYDEVVKAINPSDPGYQICTAVAAYLSGCVNEAGGASALSTANALSVAACACCISTTDIAPAYSSCANYLGSEAPQLNSQISAYDYLYTVCAGTPQICRGNAGLPPASSPTPQGSSSPSKSAASPASSATSGAQQTSGFEEQGSTVPPTQTSGSSNAPSPTGPTTGSVITTLAPACVEMVGVFESCSSATPGFTNMPFPEQAYCYCCRTADDGQVTWTDQIETYASTCRNWGATAGPGEPVTAYNVAKTFATFCHHFSDACDTSTSAPPTNTDTNNDNGPTTTAGGGPVTVTVTQKAATTTSHSGVAATARVGLAAGVVAVAGFAMMV